MANEEPQIRLASKEGLLTGPLPDSSALACAMLGGLVFGHVPWEIDCEGARISLKGDGLGRLVKAWEEQSLGMGQERARKAASDVAQKAWNAACELLEAMRVRKELEACASIGSRFIKRGI